MVFPTEWYIKVTLSAEYYYLSLRVGREKKEEIETSVSFKKPRKDTGSAESTT